MWIIKIVLLAITFGQNRSIDQCKCEQFSKQCFKVDAASCRMKNGHYMPANYSQEVCRCCPMCIDAQDYCLQCDKRKCRNDNYDQCLQEGGSYQYLSLSRKQGCRCCSQCNCCKNCQYPRCKDVPQNSCRMAVGTIIRKNTECGGRCNCCDRCRLDMGPGEDCSDNGLRSGYYRQCKFNLKCCRGLCSSTCSAN